MNGGGRASIVPPPTSLPTPVQAVPTPNSTPKSSELKIENFLRNDWNFVFVLIQRSDEEEYGFLHS